MDATARIPVIYGTRKYGGLQSHYLAASDGKSLHKDIIISEGGLNGIQGIYGITANELSINNSSSVSPVIMEGSSLEYTASPTHVFSLINVKYADASVSIGNNTLHLYANGKATNIGLGQPSNLDDAQDNDFSCYIYKLINYISGIGYGNTGGGIGGLTYNDTLCDEGWLVVNPAITTDSPCNLASFDTIACYNAPISIGVGNMSSSNSNFTFHCGSDTDGAPDNYAAVGGYRRMAWLRAYLVSSSALTGGNPVINYICQGIQVLDTRTGVIGYSENPAMIVRDYLLSTVYGAGHFVTASELDEDSFNEAADYCDGKVTYVDQHGNTITEARYTLNIILDQKKTHAEHLADMFANFGGFLVYTNNHIGLRMERSTAVSYAFTDDTIIADSIIYTGGTTDNTPNRWNITYNDPNQNWTGIVVKVEDTVRQQPYPIGRGKIIPLDVTLAGCTRQSQTLRLGRLYRDKAILCPLTVQWQTSTMAMHLEPGDVVTITKNVIANGVAKVLFDAMPFRITQISNNKGIYTIIGQQYNDSIYNDTLGAQITVPSYTAIASPLSSPVSAVTDISAVEHNKDTGNGTYLNELELSWASNDLFFNHVDVYVESDNPSWDEITDSLDDTTGSFESIGTTSGTWKFINSGIDDLWLSGLTVGLAYTFKFVSVNNLGRKSDFQSSPTLTYTVQGKTLQPLTPTGLAVSITTQCDWTWNQGDSDVDFYELREDTKYGMDAGLLAMTTTNKATVTPSARTGTVYLFAHNTAEYYSAPAYLRYNKVAPSAPQNVGIVETLHGFVVTTEAFPTYFLSMNVHMNDGTGDSILSSVNNVYTAVVSAGIYDVTVAFTDLFGEGALSASQSVVVTPYVDPEWIKAESLSLAMMDTDIKDAVTKAQDAIDTTAFTAAINSTNDLIAAITGANGLGASITTTQNADGSYSYSTPCQYSLIDGILTAQNAQSAKLYSLVIAAEGDAATILHNLNTDISGITSTNPSSYPYFAIGQLAIQSNSLAASKADLTALTMTNNSIGTIVANLNLAPDAATQYNAISELNQTANAIQESVTNIEGTMATSAQLTLTNASIAAMVGTLNSGVGATGQYSAITSLKLLTDSITATVSNNQTNLQSQITQTANSLTSIYTGLNNANSAIAQNASAIQLRATSANLISLINVCPEAITISGQYLHVTGLTVFDDSVIVGKMLKAQSITGDKFVANVSIAAPVITGGTVNGTTINGGTIIGGRIQNADNTAYIDGNGNIHGVNITASTIDADTILQAGYALKTCARLKGTIAHGGVVPLPTGYSQDDCIFGVSAIVGSVGGSGTPNVCCVDQNTRVVTAQYYDGTYYTAGSASYWVQGTH